MYIWIPWRKYRYIILLSFKMITYLTERILRNQISLKCVKFITEGAVCAEMAECVLIDLTDIIYLWPMYNELYLIMHVNYHWLLNFIITSLRLDHITIFEI